jgi:uncharacterized protein (TIGR02266 family)
VQPADKRRDERTPVTLIVDYDGAEDFLGDYTENLSRGGTFIHTSRTLEVGEAVQLVLSFPGLLEPIAVEAIVRWTRGGDDQGVGVEFVAGAGRDKLARIVERIVRRDPRVVARVCEVLVVEDNHHVAELVRSGLEASARRSFGSELAFTVMTAGDGAAALELLKARAFDVAIVDVYLPVIDGPSVIHQVRHELGLTRLPIIAVSAGGDGARQKALAAGANMFLEKPMRLRQVVESIHQLMNLRDAVT